MRPLKTPDWQYVDWHYRVLYTQMFWHNRLFVRATGLENVPRSGGFVYVANHTSWWDPIALGATVPRPVNYLAKKEIFKGPFTEWFFGKGGCIPVDRNGKNPDALAKAVEALRQGRIVGVFPEGTRHHDRLGPAKTGAARLAMEADVPVVPAGVASDVFWPARRKIPRVGQRIYIAIGAPFRIPGDPKDPDAARAATDEIMGVVAKLLEEARAARDRREKWDVP